MRTWALLLLALLSSLALTGCGKKSSKEFYEAQRKYESLISQDGDDGYLAPEMDQVSEALAAVPKRALEYDRAQALVQKISSEKARVQQERAAAALPPTSDAPYAMPNLPPSSITPPVAPTEPVAGGPAEQLPTPGMSEALFKEQFGSCVNARETFKLEGEGEVPAYPAKDTPACYKKLGIPGPARLIFVKGGYAGRVTSTSTTTRTILDGGTTVVPAPSPQAPQPLMVIPGAPLPAGATVPPPPPPGSLPAGAPGDGMQPVKAEGDLGARPNP